MKKILILGSSGQIGNHLCHFLRSLDYDVFEFDLVNGSNQDLRTTNNSYLNSLIEQSDFIFFLAFDAGGSHYLKKYQTTFEFISNNMKIMANTFELIKIYNRPFVFASSQMSNMHQSSYGTLKKIGENYTNSLNGIIVKFWNVYGIEKDESKFHVISDFIKMALTKGHINVRTSGIELRDFLYADDCCQGLVKIMEEYDELDHAQEIHLAKFEWTSIAELAALISRKLNVDFTLGEDQDTVQANIRNEPSKYFLNYWLPKISLNDGVDKIINYFLTSEKIHS